MTHEQIAAEIATDILANGLSYKTQGECEDAVLAILRKRYEPSEQAGEAKLRRELTNALEKLREWATRAFAMCHADLCDDYDRVMPIVSDALLASRRAARNQKGPTQ